MSPDVINSRQRRLRAALILALPLVALADLAAFAWARTRPTLDGVPQQALRAAFRSSYRPGDLVVGGPTSLATPALALLGDSLPRDANVFVDPSRFERAIEVSLRGAPVRDLSSWRVAEEHSFGPARLRLLTNPRPVASRFDVVSSLSPSEVQVSHGPAGGAGLPCSFSSTAEVDLPPGSPLPWAPRARFSCGSDPRAFVGAVILEDRRGTPRRCLWTWPTTNAVRLLWPRVPAGSLLRVGAIISAPPGSEPHARLRFKANGAALPERQLDSSSTFDHFDLPASMLSGGGDLSLEVEQSGDVTAPVCVEASLR